MTNPTQPIPQPFPQQPPVKQKKPLVKRVWFWVLVVLALIVAAGACSGGGDTAGTSGTSGSTSTVQQPATAENIPAEQEPAEQAAPQEDVPTEYKTALRKAESYMQTMHMSERGLYDQLTSEYGEQYSHEAAQYAIDNINADYNEAALQKAHTYQESMAMSPAAIYDQLISEYGEKFTPEQAQYAIDNLQ